MSFGLKIVADEGPPGMRVARGADKLMITKIELESGGRGVPFISAMATLSGQAPEYLPAGAFDGNPKTAWAISGYNEVPKAFLAMKFAQPLTTVADTTLTIRIRQDADLRRATLGRFRAALSPSEYSWPTPDLGKEIPDPVLRALRIAEAQRTPAQKTAIANHFEWAAPESQTALTECSTLEQS